MGIDHFVKQTYPIECKGRNEIGDEALDAPVKVLVEVYKSQASNTISSIVRCLYNTGGHGQRCKASHPDVDKIGEGVGCPYSFDLPYALEKKLNFDPILQINLLFLVGEPSAKEQKEPFC